MLTRKKKLKIYKLFEKLKDILVTATPLSVAEEAISTEMIWQVFVPSAGCSQV